MNKNKNKPLGVDGKGHKVSPVLESEPSRENVSVLEGAERGSCCWV